LYGFCSREVLREQYLTEAELAVYPTAGAKCGFDTEVYVAEVRDPCGWKGIAALGARENY